MPKLKEISNGRMTRKSAPGQPSMTEDHRKMLQQAMEERDSPTRAFRSPTEDDLDELWVESVAARGDKDGADTVRDIIRGAKGGSDYEQRTRVRNHKSVNGVLQKAAELGIGAPAKVDEVFLAPIKELVENAIHETWPVMKGHPGILKVLRDQVRFLNVYARLVREKGGEK